MVRHVAMFRWNDDVPAGHAEAVSAALDELATAIPEIVTYSHGPNLGLNPGTWDYVVVADFADAAGQAAYRDHPQHQDFISRYLTGFIRERAAVQYESGTGE